MSTTESISIAESGTQIARLLRQQKALALFGSFAFSEPDLQKVLAEAARICAEGLNTQYCKICRYRPESNDLIIEAGVGWRPGDVIGDVVSAESWTPQARAFSSRSSIIMSNIQQHQELRLPSFYATYGITSTIDVCIQGADDMPYGVLEVDSPDPIIFDERDVAFLIGYANVLAGTVDAANRTAALHAALERMSALIDDKAILAQELQHRVRNNLQLINGMLAEQLTQSIDVRSESGIRGIMRRVMSLSRVYDHLLGVGMKRTVDFAEYARLLCTSLTELQKNPDQNVTLSYHGDSIHLDLDAVTALGLALAEVVANCYEHAFPDGTGTIEVTLLKEESNRGLLVVHDDGVGFVEGVLSKRHGVGLIKRLMQQARGTAEQDKTQVGTTWLLRFPTTNTA